MIDDATGEDGILDVTKLDGDYVRANLVNSTPFLNSIRIYSIGRRFCVTTRGYMGRVPHGSAVGYMICIFFGGCIPFVLRECSDRYFRLIGECYTHGVMDGEAMKHEDIENLSRDFEIR